MPFCVDSAILLVTRDRLRESIRRVDPVGRIARRPNERTPRRVYRVGGPNHLWHFDGNHKLNRWGIVIHGCIDGFTRGFIYLQARDNNLAITVLDIFEIAVMKHGWPYRAMRSDMGGENIGDHRNILLVYCFYLFITNIHHRPSAMLIHWALHYHCRCRARVRGSR